MPQDAGLHSHAVSAMASMSACLTGLSVEAARRGDAAMAASEGARALEVLPECHRLSDRGDGLPPFDLAPALLNGAVAELLVPPRGGDAAAAITRAVANLDAAVASTGGAFTAWPSEAAAGGEGGGGQEDDWTRATCALRVHALLVRADISLKVLKVRGCTVPASAAVADTRAD